MAPAAKTLRMKPAYLILLIAMNVLWAGAYSAFKALAPYLDAGGLTTARFGLAAVFLVVAWPWFSGRAPRGRDLMMAILMGLLVFVIAPGLQVAGVQRGQATDAAVLMALEPLIASVAAAIFLQEHIGPRRWVGFSLGMSGVVLMSEIWRPDFHWPGLAANTLIVASFVAECAFSVLGKPLLGRVGILKLLTVAILSGSVVNLLLNGNSTVHTLLHLPGPAWWLLLYLSLVLTLIGFAVWFVVIRETEVNVAALTIFIQPVVGVWIATAWLGESLRTGQLWGSLAIVAGLVIGLSRQLRWPRRKE